ncbi:MAG: hypothetical protein ACK4Z0_09325, partial [Sphingomonadaceae bacterium]
GRSIALPPAGRLAARLGAAPVQRVEGAGDAGALRYSLAFLAPAGGRPSAGNEAFRDARPAEAHLGLAQRGVDARAGNRTRPGDARLTLSDGALRFTVATGRLAEEALPGAAAGGFVARDASEGIELPASRLVGGLGWTAGALSIGLSASRAAIDLPETFGLSRRAEASRMSAGAAVWHGGLLVAASLALTDESGAWLGTRLSPAFGLAGGRGIEAGGALSADLGAFDLRAAATAGWHRPRLADGGLLRADGPVETLAWSVAASAPIAGGRLSARLAGPPAVVGGGLRLANGAPLALAPAAREMAAELGYAREGLELAAFRRVNAGHLRGLGDQGVALRLSREF